MKLKNIFSLMAGTVFAFTACSPDDYSFGDAQYSSDDLKCPDAYTVTINGNKVDLASKISGCTPLWVTPSGRSQEQNLTLELPFAGDYEVTFGAETRAGAVYGDPYTFTIPQNDFTLLSSPLWFYLADSNYKTGEEFPDDATLVAGISKKWYPCDKDYGLGCTGPMFYITPYDPTNTGNYTDDEASNLVYKDITFGRSNWSPNWDPGFQSWLIPEEDPYMDSYMEFSMDAANGCVINEYRGESGSKGSSTGTTSVGKFNLSLSDALHPTITFSDAYCLHHIGGDDMCSNYAQDIIIAEMTPYYLCLVTKRTNSEGNWYLAWNFVSEEVKNSNGACIPAAEANLLQKSEPVLPEYSSLASDIFTVESNGTSYVGSKVTYTVDTDAPYDFYWWNGASGVNDWETLLDGNYNNTWAPAPEDDVWDNELVLSKSSTGEISFTYGDTEGTATLTSNTIKFSSPVKFLASSNDFRTVAVEGTEFTILKMTAAEGMTLGVPESKDESGKVVSYLVVNLATKAIGSATTGPTVVALTDDYLDHSWFENNCYRLAFYHYGDGGTGIFKDATSVKLKKDQTITVTFTLKDASAWTAAPKCALIDNNIKTNWEPTCFTLDDAVTVNLSGQTVVTLKNTTGATQKFTPTCLDLSIQMDGYYKDYVSGMDVPDIIQSVVCTIE